MPSQSQRQENVKTTIVSMSSVLLSRMLLLMDVVDIAKDMSISIVLAHLR